MIFFVRTAWRFIRCQCWRFCVDRCTAKPVYDPAAVVHCSHFALGCSSIYAEDLAATVEHDCYDETCKEDESEDDSENRREE